MLAKSLHSILFLAGYGMSSSIFYIFVRLSRQQKVCYTLASNGVGSTAVKELVVYVANMVGGTSVKLKLEKEGLDHEGRVVPMVEATLPPAIGERVQSYC